MGVMTGTSVGVDKEHSTQVLNKELQDKGFLVTSTADMINWARTGSLHWMTFGLACCAVEMMQTVADTTTTAIPLCAAVTGSCRLTSTCRAVRQLRKHCFMVSCNCSGRSAGQGQSSAKAALKGQDYDRSPA